MELFIRFYWFPISQNEITCSGEQVRYNANREKQSNEFNSKKKKKNSGKTMKSISDFTWQSIPFWTLSSFVH